LRIIAGNLGKTFGRSVKCILLDIGISQIFQCFETGLMPVLGNGSVPGRDQIIILMERKAFGHKPEIIKLAFIRPKVAKSLAQRPK